ncbi:MAG TPA: hypothetical protein VH813_11295 [Candidatus Limnocylindrales bacterium]|jgi:hypothetical protein
MRGCLATLVLAVVFLGIAGWFGGLPVAGLLVETGLGAGGLQAADLDVTVETEPRWELLGGRADHVRIVATNADLRGSSVERVDLDLTDVSIADRRAGRVDGELEGIVVHEDGPADGLRIERIRLDGSDPIVASAEIDNADAEALVARGVRESTGTEPASVSLEAPDRLSIGLGATTLTGRLTVAADGSLVLSVPGIAGAVIGDLVLVDAASLPIELRSVSVGDGIVVLEGVLAPGLVG